MSFSLSFNARSRSHALALLEQRKNDVPAPVHGFLRTAIESLSPVSGHELRAIEVNASGHLADPSSGSYSGSNASLTVKPTFVPD